jgi:hypothetical protein
MKELEQERHARKIRGYEEALALQQQRRAEERERKKQLEAAAKTAFVQQKLRNMRQVGIELDNARKKKAKEARKNKANAKKTLNENQRTEKRADSAVSIPIALNFNSLLFFLMLIINFGVLCFITIAKTFVAKMLINPNMTEARTMEKRADSAVSISQSLLVLFRFFFFNAHHQFFRSFVL